jgi:glycosyltransferase involved in cell wall biosynthesis
MSDILFVHNNFPGQFGFIAGAMYAQGHRCAIIGSKTARQLSGMAIARWNLTRGTTPGIFDPATRCEADMIRGRAAAEQALGLKKKGFDPEIIVGHPGWGETVFLGEIFPKAKQILHGEFYYRSEGGDVGFDPEFGALGLEERFRIHGKNATMAMCYADARRIVCPTRFQASVLPEAFQPKIEVIHEGVDTGFASPKADAVFTLKDGRKLDRSTPVITFINRRFEPLRGYHVFMRALPRLMAEVPEAQVLLIGHLEGRGYGQEAPKGQSWRQHFLDEVKDRLDPERLHFTGPLAHEEMIDALRISAAHVYYTYPFVLSWSLIEALSCECLVLGSDTAPLRDAITSGENGILNDFFDTDALSQAMIEACRRPADFIPLRKAARQTAIERFDRETICQPAWLKVVDDVRAGD